MVNDIIDGKYQIISKIGSGGTSIVYKAQRLADEKIVAIKIIREELDNVKENERHFYLEAEALSKMSHRNIRRIFGVGQWNDSLYMVTEFIDGLTLKDIISEGKLTTQKAVDYALQIAAGIEHAHRKDIIHRDIKPQNVIVSNDGTVKIVDFGIARMTSQTTRTMAGKDVVGSVHYLSPEQARGAQVDNRSDIYSFGILLYEMFTGKVPFEGTEAVSIAMRHVNQIPEPPQSVNPEITSGINDIIVKCIQKDPENRYQTASELREDLLLYVANPDGFSVVKAETLQGRDNFEPEEETPSSQLKSFVVPETEDDSENKRKRISRTSKRKKSRRPKVGGYFVLLLSLIVLVIAVILAIKFIPLMIPEEKEYPQNTVPLVSGYSKEEAVALLHQASFSKFDYEYADSNDVSQGNVIKTEPAGGEFVEVNTEIVIYISRGGEQIMAQNTIGMSISEAEKVLNDQGILVKVINVQNSEKETGTVVAQSNLTGKVRVGDTITLTVVDNSSKKLIVPDIMGMTDLDAIKAKITAAGFKVGSIKEVAVSSNSTQGVSWQSLEGGMEINHVITDDAPMPQLDFNINVVKKTYKCIYEFETPDGDAKDFLLIVYTSSGDLVDEFTYTATSSVFCDYPGERSESYIFELYVDNQLVDKKTISAKLSEGVNYG